MPPSASGAKQGRDGGGVTGETREVRGEEVTLADPIRVSHLFHTG